MSVVDLLEDDVARQHRSDTALLLQRLVCKFRVACAEDQVGTKVDVQLLLQRRRDIDGRENAEALRGKRALTRSTALPMGSTMVLLKQ